MTPEELTTTAKEMLAFIENARDLAIDSHDEEVIAEVLGDYCGELIAKAKGETYTTR